MAMYKEEQIVYFKKEILRRLLEDGGKSLSQIFREDEDFDLCSREYVYNWLNSNNSRYDESFANGYAEACSERAERMFEETIRIADDGSQDLIVTDDGKMLMNHEFAARSRLRVQARHWALARMQPEKYGKKIETTIQGGKKPIEVLDYSKLSVETLEEIAKQSNAGKSKPE